VCAIAGFSYALATSLTAESSAVAARGLAGTLTFTTPFFPGTLEHDLGDAAFGSQIVRWIQASGGVPTYKFYSDSTITQFKGAISLANAVAKLARAVLPPSDQPDYGTEAQLLFPGLLQGQIGNIPSALPAGKTSLPLQFDVTAVDSQGANPNSRTDSFQITMVNSNVFKFAQTSLNDAALCQDYYGQVDMIGGVRPFTFAPGLITLTAPGGTVTSIAPAELGSAMGLFFDQSTGALIGRPLQAGLLQITLACTDAYGRVAQARNLSGPGQTLSINVLPNPMLHSRFFSTSIIIKGGVIEGGKDSIQYSGIINLGAPLASFYGEQLTLTIGNYTSPAVTLNTLGQGSTGMPKKKAGSGRLNKPGPEVQVNISPSGQIKITVSNESFGVAGSILQDITVRQAVLPVSIAISNNAFMGGEVLNFGIKARYQNFYNNFQMNYQLGAGNLAGGFLLTGVQGQDDSAGSGSAWKAGFIFLPPGGQSFISAGSATVNIGGFSNSINVSITGGTLTGAKRGNNAPQIVGLGVSPRGQSFVKTSSLPAAATNIPVAEQVSGQSVLFPFLISLNAVNASQLFGGADAQPIFANGRTWRSP
jgi:hypothetical protein